MLKWLLWLVLVCPSHAAEFDGRVGIVTGGASGIGRATALKLAELGAKVYVWDIQACPPDFEAKGISCVSDCDITDLPRLQAEVEKILKEKNRIDFLFANAGVHTGGDVLSTPLDVMSRIVDVNILGTVHSMRTVIPVMQRQKFGRILINSSEQSLIGKPMSAIYGLTKAAVAQLAKSSALQFIGDGIVINAIAPGATETPLLHRALDVNASLSGRSVDQVCAGMIAAQPIGRVLTAEEIARVATTLLSPENTAMVGAVVVVDGGYTAR